MVMGTLILAGVSFLVFVSSIACAACSQGGVFGFTDVATRFELAEARASFHFRSDFRSASQPPARILGAALMF